MMSLWERWRTRRNKNSIVADAIIARAHNVDVWQIHTEYCYTRGMMIYDQEELSFRVSVGTGGGPRVTLNAPDSKRVRRALNDLRRILDPEYNLSPAQALAKRLS